MRLRFSLRTLFIVTTLLAAAFYWFVLPTLTAQRFIRAIARGDFQAADAYFSDDGDRFLKMWNDKHWGFLPQAELLPLSLAQLLAARREVRIEITYFELDQNIRCHALIAASPLEFQTLEISPKRRSGIIIDRDGFNLPSTPQR